jgi:hypothetical protein
VLVATGLVLRDRVPVRGRGSGVGRAAGHCHRRCDEATQHDGPDERLAELFHVKLFARRVRSVTDSNKLRDKKSMAIKSARQMPNESLFEPNLLGAIRPSRRSEGLLVKVVQPASADDLASGSVERDRARPRMDEVPVQRDLGQHRLVEAIDG